MRQELPSLDIEIIKSPPLKVDGHLGHDFSKKIEIDALAKLSHAYLSKLDISAELADPELYEE